ncbi:MAG: alcohol dehydrogenase catalytic domain-containing protein [Gammaproteobacteria bacterium]|nr:alcohol dehydrogenase catalytic domain-containing protein [Gammaproteobacteria bacterium]
MKAAVFAEDGSISIQRVDIPELQPGWCQLAVTAVGICGTDLHIKTGILGSPAGIRPGHEIAAVIDSTGDNVELKTGTSVMVEPVLGCGTCEHCRSGNPNRCASKEFFGHTLPGGLAEFIQVPESIIVLTGSDIPPNITALIEPMGICVRGARRANIQLGKRVAILGAGSIGLLSILSAYAAGAEEVFVSARHKHQQEVARHFGASAVFKDSESLLEELGDQYIDVVIETVGGIANTLSDAVLLARTGGTILLLGAFKNNPSIPALRFMTNELTLVASNCHGQEGVRSDLMLAADLVRKYAGQLEVLNTHRFKLDQVAEAFAVAEDKHSNSIKVQLSP